MVRFWKRMISKRNILNFLDNWSSHVFGRSYNTRFFDYGILKNLGSSKYISRRIPIFKGKIDDWRAFKGFELSVSIPMPLSDRYLPVIEKVGKYRYIHFSNWLLRIKERCQLTLRSSHKRRILSNNECIKEQK